MFDNFRDLGGLVTADGRTIKPGKLYRTPKLYTKVDKRKERKEKEAFLDGLAIDTVLDLRSTPEMKEKPDYVPSGATYYHVPFFGPTEVDRIIVTRRSVARMLSLRGDRIPLLVEDKEESYRIMPYSNGQIALKALFEALDRGDTILFHCTEGKDRTGFLAYILELTLGRRPEDAREEYLKSNEAMEEKSQSQSELLTKLHFPKELIDALDYVEHCHNELLDLSLEAIYEKYATVDEYLEKEFDVTEERKEAYRNTYLF